MKSKGRSPQKRSIDTRKNLMQNGARLFSKYGYDATSVRDICCAAGANIAAVHYYFKDKQGLYETILKESFSDEAGLFPDPLWDKAGSPQKYLEDLVFTIISRMHRTKKKSWHADLVRREISFPSAPFRKFIDEIIRHDFELFMRALRAVDPRADDDRLKRAVLCITGQIGAYTSHPPEFLNLCFPKIEFTENECRTITLSIIHFVIRGLKEPMKGEKRA